MFLFTPSPLSRLEKRCGPCPSRTSLNIHFPDQGCFVSRLVEHFLGGPGEQIFIKCRRRSLISPLRIRCGPPFFLYIHRETLCQIWLVLAKLALEKMKFQIKLSTYFHYFAVTCIFSILKKKQYPSSKNAFSKIGLNWMCFFTSAQYLCMFMAITYTCITRYPLDRFRKLHLDSGVS